MSLAQEQRRERVLEDMSQEADAAAKPHRDRIKQLEAQIAVERQAIAAIYAPYGAVLMKD
ncbi:hypothetical protein D9M71_710170 [compost metagenome]